MSLDDGELEPLDAEALAGQDERFLPCPHCGQKISVLLDTSVDEQVMTEDCEVCCRPIEYRYAVEDGEVTEFSAEAA